jgi:DNA-binding transcriptional LysR family regulator
MSDLETRQLRYFVAVGEERHFGRAAARLGIAQPSLSRAIADLERQLGVLLLTRTTRQVALTPAGEDLLDDARTALDAVAAAGLRARRHGHRPSLRVALKAECDAGLLPEIVNAYNDLLPADRPPVDLVLGGRGEQVRPLHDGRADVALLPMPFDRRGLEAEPLLTGPRVVALSANDALAGHAYVRLSDLTGRRLPDGTRVGDDASEATRKLDLSQTLSLVGVGCLVWLLPAWAARRLTRTGVVYRPVQGLPPATLAVAWPRAWRQATRSTFDVPFAHLTPHAGRGGLAPDKMTLAY